MNYEIKEVKLSDALGTDLSSRARAAQLRNDLFSDPAVAPRVAFNFNGVRAISSSFADELFAVLAEKHGEEWFTGHVAIKYANGNIRDTIIEAIQERVNPVNKRT